MARHYGSFLIRYWDLDGDENRIEIEHVQSGDHTRVTSLTAGLAWIEARVGAFGRANRTDPADPSDCDEEVMNGDEILG